MGLRAINLDRPWDDQQDVARYISSWGKSQDYYADTMARMEANLSKVHAVLGAGIDYVSDKREMHHTMPSSTLALKEKIALLQPGRPCGGDLPGKDQPSGK